MFLCLLLSPVKDTVVTNDRWCDNGCRCQHGGVFTCHDHYNPGESSCDVFLAAHMREGCSQPSIFSYFYLTIGSCLSVHYRVMEHAGSLESTKKCKSCPRR